MDDVNFGVDSAPEGRALLRDIDLRLNMLGVRLNTGKTRILSSDEARDHFLLQENRQLTIIGNSYQHGARSVLLQQLAIVLLEERYDRFLTKPRDGAWGKVLKRYYTAFGKTRHDYLDSHIAEHLRAYPDARESVFRYLGTLGFSSDRFDRLEHYVREHCTDDASLFRACRVIVDWQIPRRSAYRSRCTELADWLRRHHKFRVSAFCAGLWLMAKYASRTRLWNYVKQGGAVWQRSAWAARQVASTFPRLTPAQRRYCHRYFAAGGLLEALQVSSHIAELETMSRLDQQLRSYLSHPVADPYSYPVGKVLVLRSLKHGTLTPADNAWLDSQAASLVTDPVCQELIS